MKALSLVNGMGRHSMTQKWNQFRVKFRLQFFHWTFLGWAVVLSVLIFPAALTAHILHNLAWLVFVPFGIIVLALFIAALPIRRKVTQEQFATELESHLLGTEGPWDWDRTTSVAIADPRLDAVRSHLGPNLDSLSRDQDRDELRTIIEALRRGELPEVTASARQGFLFRRRE